MTDLILTFRNKLIKTDLGVGRDSGPCPWKAIALNPEAFIDHKTFMPFMSQKDEHGNTISVPVKLLEPSKMQRDGISRLLRHWKKRQNRGLVPFCFNHVILAKTMVEANSLDVPPEALLPLEDEITATLGSSSLDTEPSLLHSPGPILSGQNANMPVMNSSARLNLSAPVDPSVPVCPSVPVSPSAPSPTSAPTNPSAPQGHSAPKPLSSPNQAVTHTRSTTVVAASNESQGSLISKPTHISARPPIPEYPSITLTPPVQPAVEVLDPNIFDPFFPQLTQKQVSGAASSVYTTNALAGVRVFTETPSETSVAAYVPLPPNNDSMLFNKFLDFMKAQAADPHTPTKVPTTLALHMNIPPTPETPLGPKKRGRPRKSVGTSGSSTMSSPPTKRAKGAEDSAIASTSAHKPRPKPRPLTKKSGPTADLSDIEPYNGLITRNMAALQDNIDSAERHTRKANGKGKGKA